MVISLGVGIGLSRMGSTSRAIDHNLLICKAISESIERFGERNVKFSDTCGVRQNSMIVVAPVAASP